METTLTASPEVATMGIMFTIIFNLFTLAILIIFTYAYYKLFKEAGLAKAWYVWTGG